MFESVRIGRKHPIPSSSAQGLSSPYCTAGVKIVFSLMAVKGIVGKTVNGIRIMVGHFGAIHDGRVKENSHRGKLGYTSEPTCQRSCYGLQVYAVQIYQATSSKRSRIRGAPVLSPWFGTMEVCTLVPILEPSETAL